MNRSLTLATIVGLSVFLVSCTKSSSNSTAAFDPWNAPTGNLIDGATLADGWRDLRELPAPVAVSGGWTDSAAVTGDGRHLYYAYTTLDFGLFQDSGGATQNFSGPSRPGMTGGHFKMFRADLSAAGWRENFLPFNGAANVHEASASPNAAGDLIVFSRFDSSGVATMYLTSLVGGNWSTPAALPTAPAVNSPNSTCTNDNGFIVGTLAAGYTLYFESNRATAAGSSCRGDGKSRLYMVDYTPGSGFGTPQAVPGLDLLEAGESDTQISVSADKSKVYFTHSSNTAYGVYTAGWSGSTYSGLVQIVTPNFASPFTGKLVMTGEANVATTPSGTLLYMMCGIGQSETAQHNPRIVPCVARKP